MRSRATTLGASKVVYNFEEMHFGGVHICNMELGSESNNVPDRLESLGLKSVAYLSTIVLDAHYFLYED